MRHKKSIIIIISFILSILVASILSFIYLDSSKTNSYVKEYKSSSENSLFIGECSTELFTGDYFEHYLGEPVFFPSYDIKSKKMASVLSKAFEINQSIDTVWVILDPFNNKYSVTNNIANANLTNLSNFINAHADVRFNLFLYSPSVYEWNRQNSKIEEKIASYKAVITILSDLPNVTISFPGHEEWYLANKDLFSEASMNEGIVSKLVGGWIAGLYYVDSSALPNMDDRLITLCQKYRNINHANLSDKRIVFFGDSIIGNYTDATGICLLTNSMCRIQTDNRAIGGTTATFDFVPAVKKYFSETDQNNDFYLINYGFNDYIQLLPIDGPQSYSEGIRNGIQTIRENDPKANIIIASPYSVIYDNAGLGPDIYEYIEACQKIALESQCFFIDYYTEFSTNSSENAYYYLADDIHLDEYGRLKYTEVLVSFIESLLTNK